MSFIIADRTQESTTTQGTGTLSLLGAVPQFQTFSSGIGNGNSTYYSIIDGNGLAWETGIGIVGAGTLARSAVLSSSNSNTLVNLSAFGPHLVFCDAPATAVQLISSIATNTILANLTSGSAAPTANTLSAILDYSMSSTQGVFLYRGAATWAALGTGTNGQVLTTQGASANPIWVTLGLSSLPTQTNNTILSNISGITATPSANTLTAIIDTISSTQGVILYRNSTVWAALATGTSGYFLQTGGASANPQWALAVTSVATGTGLTGGTITSTGTISLAAIASNNILANITGGSAAPLANTLTAIIDTIGSAQGDILYRGASAWGVLAPSTSGYFLQTGGASANPTWAAISSLSSSSLAAQANNTILSNISGGAASPSANTLTTIIDSCIGSTQGDILYRNSSIWAVLAPGTAGQSLVTGGASANPAWTTLGYSNLPAEIQNSLAVATIPGLQPTSSKVMVVPITQNTQVPANFANSQGYSITNATGTFIYTVGYIHSGTPASIGTVTFTGAGSTPTFSTQAFVNLVAGDVLYISTQSSGDGTLADVGITLILLKQ